MAHALLMRKARPAPTGSFMRFSFAANAMLPADQRESLVGSQAHPVEAPRSPAMFAGCCAGRTVPAVRAKSHGLSAPSRVARRYPPAQRLARDQYC